MTLGLSSADLEVLRALVDSAWDCHDDCPTPQDPLHECGFSAADPDIGGSPSVDKAEMEEYFLVPEPRPIRTLGHLLEAGLRLRLPHWESAWVHLVRLVVRIPAEQISLLQSATFLRENAVLSRTLLHAVQSIKPPAERGRQLGQSLLYLQARDAVVAIEDIATLPSELARCEAVEAGYWMTMQAHPNLADRLIDIASHLEQPAPRARALLACLSYEPTSPEERKIVAQVLSSVDAGGDKRQQVFCHLKLDDISDRWLAKLRQIPDSRFQLDAWQYLVASERNGLSGDATKYVWEYILVCGDMPHSEAVDQMLSLVAHLSSFQGADELRTVLVDVISSRIRSVRNCARRRQLLLKVGDFTHEW